MEDKIKAAIDGVINESTITLEMLRDECKRVNVPHSPPKGCDEVCKYFKYCYYHHNAGESPKHQVFPNEQRAALISDLKSQIEKNEIKREELFESYNRAHSTWIKSVHCGTYTGSIRYYYCEKCGYTTNGCRECDDIKLESECPRCSAIMDNAEEST